MGGKNEKPKWGVTSVIFIVCLKENIPWRAK